MFVLTILETIKEARLKVSQGSVTVLWKIANYEKAWVKLTNTQRNELKSGAENKTWTTLEITLKIFKMINRLMNYF